MFYFAIIVYICILIYIYDYKCYAKNKEFWYTITTWIFILLAGLRYRIGSDTLSYEFIFNNLPLLFQLSVKDIFDGTIVSVEPGYAIAMSAFKTIFCEFWVFQLAQSWFVNAVIFYFFKKNSRCPYIAILLYFIVLYYYINCEAARQGCAVAILLLSWKFFMTNKTLKFYACVILAASFHSSAVIFLILPLFKFVKLWDKVRFEFTTVCIIVLCFILGYQIERNLYSLFSASGLEKLEYRAWAYLGDNVSTTYKLSTYISYLVFFIMLPYYGLKRINNNSRDFPLTPMVIICCIINVTGVSFFYRISYYFWPFYFIFFSESFFIYKPILSGKSNTVRWAHSSNWRWFLAFALLILYKTHQYYVPDEVPSVKVYSRFYPYNSIIDQGRDKDRERLWNYYDDL